MAEEEEEEESEDEDDSWLYPGRFDPLAAEKARRAQEEEMHQRIAARKKRNLDPMLHCEGESDVEDIYDNATQCDDISTIPAVKRQVKRPGPTLRSHSQVEADVIPDWVPSDDEGDKGFLKEEEDDGYEPLPFVLAGGRKSRGKMAKERVWYDDSRQNPEQQFMVGLCFKDVYQFRQALARLHIVQVRNFLYHRNTPDRIIVWCKDKQKKNNEENVKEKEKKWDCPLYMTAAKIKNEATFCIKKMELKHTCPTDPSSTRVNAKWLSGTYVTEYKSNISTSINTLQDKAPKDFGVDVPKRMAYRARTKATEMVMGDHKQQYHRLRDYLQTVIDKNPGSRCIVTTITGPTDEQVEAMKTGQMVDISYSPRFHGLFFCVNAAREGFLQGCRPFIGLDGCFIKLTSGAQILAATGRDGNNNIYPIA
ncbi:hypothetical protein QYE76_063883 [Lolium multiflorum]|uniref:Transposase MuDR plant domain-containing protein n=1 Tax=Lolium multiflorum TaxID=4521 RepID=A0AAD8S7B7_LOLMU|nr:hypothetical protein QYE76_063883 [Lolium multiflorum]